MKIWTYYSWIFCYSLCKWAHFLCSSETTLVSTSSGSSLPWWQSANIVVFSLLLPPGQCWGKTLRVSPLWEHPSYIVMQLALQICISAFSFSILALHVLCKPATAVSADTQDFPCQTMTRGFGRCHLLQVSRARASSWGRSVRLRPSVALDRLRVSARTLLFKAFCFWRA